MLTPEFDRANRIAIGVQLGGIAAHIAMFVTAKGAAQLVMSTAALLFMVMLTLSLVAARDEQRRLYDEVANREALRRLRGAHLTPWSNP